MSQDKASPRPPAWIGIGAQRAGTTWFTRLLLRHPDVCLAPLDRDFLRRKELHAFDEGLRDGSQPGLTDRYRRFFAGSEASHPGEFTPSYLRSPVAAGLAHEAAGDETVLICLLRDPVERFYSALRWARRWKAESPALAELFEHRGAWSRLVGGDAAWGGMYAAQLRIWRDLFGVDRIVVLQYEQARLDPSAAVERAWASMGLLPVDLGPPEPLSETAVTGGDPEIPRLRAHLAALYRPEVGELERDWGIDPGLWPSVR